MALTDEDRQARQERLNALEQRKHRLEQELAGQLLHAGLPGSTSLKVEVREGNLKLVQSEGPVQV